MPRPNWPADTYNHHSLWFGIGVQASFEDKDSLPAMVLSK